MKEITKQMVKQLRADCEEALKAVAEKHGLTLRHKRCSFYRDQCPVPLEFVVVQTTEEGDEVTPEGRTFFLRAGEYGLEADWLHQSFTHGGERFKITGLNPRAHKYPVQIQGADGRKRKAPVSLIKACMAVELLKREAREARE